MKYIVLLGWSIYPIGYAYVGLSDEADKRHDTEMFHAIFNVADVINKVVFGLMVWWASSKPQMINFAFEFGLKSLVEFIFCSADSNALCY